jgi:hypothetical protein
MRVNRHEPRIAGFSGAIRALASRSGRTWAPPLRICERRIKPNLTTIARPRPRATVTVAIARIRTRICICLHSDAEHAPQPLHNHPCLPIHLCGPPRILLRKHRSRTAGLPCAGLLDALDVRLLATPTLAGTGDAERAADERRDELRVAEVGEVEGLAECVPGEFPEGDRGERVPQAGLGEEAEKVDRVEWGQCGRDGCRCQCQCERDYGNGCRCRGGLRLDASPRAAQIARVRGLRRGRDGVLRGGGVLTNTRGEVCGGVEDEAEENRAGGVGSGTGMVRRGLCEDVVWRAVELPEVWDEGDPVLRRSASTRRREGSASARFVATGAGGAGGTGAGPLCGASLRVGAGGEWAWRWSLWSLLAGPEQPRGRRWQEQVMYNRNRLRLHCQPRGLSTASARRCGTPGVMEGRRRDGRA